MLISCLKIGTLSWITWGGPSIITSILKSGNERWKSQREIRKHCSAVFEDGRKEAMSQAMQAAARNRKRQGSGPFSTASRVTEF